MCASGFADAERSGKERRADHWQLGEGGRCHGKQRHRRIVEVDSTTLAEPNSHKKYLVVIVLMVRHVLQLHLLLPQSKIDPTHHG